MTAKEQLESILLEYPVCEYCFGDTSQIPFTDKVFFICETDCPRYGHSWACPPNAGKIEDNIERVRSYKNFLLFSTIWEVPDALLIDSCLPAKKAHEELTRDFRHRLQAEFPAPFYTLSAGCTICDECACPDEPCRHPEERLMSAESHGIVLLQLVSECGMTFYYGSQEVAYFSLALF